MRRLLRLTGATLAVIALMLVFQPRPAATIEVRRAEARENGVVRADGRAAVDLNRADEALLEAIPGVGPVLAARILAHIQEKGALKAPEELLEVEGIGPEKLRSIEQISAIIP